jgi:hypothetical protein
MNGSTSHFDHAVAGSPFEGGEQRIRPVQLSAQTSGRCHTANAGLRALRNFVLIWGHDSCCPGLACPLV